LNADNLGRVDLLKLDIEGAETQVLREAQHRLDRVERIFVEYHSLVDKPQNLPELLGVLAASEFRFFATGSERRVRPFHGVPADRGIDLQLNIFAIKTQALGNAASR
jgi:hypothetical protein